TAVPVIAIEAVRAETAEPLCPPDTCLAPVPAPGVFVISRRGGDLTLRLAGPLRTGGTASNGVDYSELPGFVLVADNQTTIELKVPALFDELAEGDETALVELLPDLSMGPIERYRL